VWSKRKETIKKSATRNIRFIQAAVSVVTSTRISPYSSKFSKKLYTQHQLLALVLFKDYRNQHYREFIEGIGDMDNVQESLDLPNVPAARHYTAQDNGLVQPWQGRVYLNPPFGPGVEQWFSKLYLERTAGRTTEAIVLWKSATETAAWKTLTAISCRVCFPSARIRFSGPSGDSGPGPTFSPALFYIGERPERFEKAFDVIGAVWVVPGKCT
jgi:hypothetical protein